MRFGVLGPLVAEDARGPVDLKGPRHRAVLARLLIARGQVVPVDRLVDDLWQVPPDGAVGAIQTFVAALRRTLEPDRPPRTPAKLLVTLAPGYALQADSVDATQFEAAVAACRELLEQHQPEAALSQIDEALALWRGPAYAEFSDQAWAREEITRLDEVRLLAQERRAEALLALGRAEAVPALEAQVEAHPLRENGWRLLALALYRAGRQGDALAALRRARTVLAAELGVDPGPGLRQVEADILAQAPSLAAVPSRLVGRADELAQLAQAAATAVNRGRLGLVLISGDAGAGKTALAESFGAGLGWTTAWGTNPDHEGVPAAWPWRQILDTLGAELAPATRFEWHQAVRSHLAKRSPLLLVLDDLHWAGEETLAVLTSVVTEPIAQPVLVVATYRTTDVSAELADFLGRAARGEPTRIYLGGLPLAAVPELVRDAIGRDVDPETARVIHQRSGGNPFFARELARLVDSGLASVPPGVRDVVRYRVAKLPASVQAILRQAAMIGTDIDLDLLDDNALDAIEVATARGFLVELGPQRFQFAHALVRDTLYQDMSQSRRARGHAAIAELIEQVRPGDVNALAHHFLLAGSPRAAKYARAAAEQAERLFAPHEAARLWEAALAASDDVDVQVRLDMIMGRARAMAVTGALDQARQDRLEALTLAAGDPALTAQVIGAFVVPAIWTDNDDPDLARRIAEVTSRTLDSLPSTALADRSRLLSTLALELRSTGGEEVRSAALEAEAIARSLDDPEVLAFALNARFMQSFYRAGLAPERARIGTEIVTLATEHSLVPFEVLGHLILLQAHSALAEFNVATRHAEAADRLGDEYQIPLVSVFTRWYRALRTAVAGHPAEAVYRAAGAGLSGTGMSGLDNGILAFALFCNGIRDSPDFGAYESWCRPAESVPDSPRDLLYEARTCLHATIAIERGDRSAMERLYTALKPATGELAGAGSGLLTLGPVAQYLGDLATALDRLDAAAEHYRQALTIATKAAAPHWIAAALSPG